MPEPMVPPAPTLFSTSTFWPRYWPRPCATWRATASTEPPGGKGTIMVTGLVGKDWAKACPVTTNAPTTSRKRIAFISFLLGLRGSRAFAQRRRQHHVPPLRPHRAVPAIHAQAASGHEPCMLRAQEQHAIGD